MNPRHFDVRGLRLVESEQHTLCLRQECANQNALTIVVGAQVFMGCRVPSLDDGSKG
jgi:hypothetical protein